MAEFNKVVFPDGTEVEVGNIFIEKYDISNRKHIEIKAPGESATLKIGFIKNEENAVLIDGGKFIAKDAEISSIEAYSIDVKSSIKMYGNDISVYNSGGNMMLYAAEGSKTVGLGGGFIEITGRGLVIRDLYNNILGEFQFEDSCGCGCGCYV